jgi:predicted nuclease with TOPRIM domain
MKPLHQQITEKRRQIAADEALVFENRHLHTTHQAKERLPRLREELAKLETDLELSEAAHHQLTTALSNLRTVTNGGRELSLAITHAEDALHRTRLHLGEPATPSA